MNPLSTVSTVSTSFLKFTGLQVISVQEDMIDFDVHMAQASSAHVPSHGTEKGISREVGKGIRTACFGKIKNHETEHSR